MSDEAEERPVEAEPSAAEDLEAKAALSASHGKAEQSLREAVQATERLAGAATRLKASVEALHERQKALGGRTADAKAALGRMSEAHARLSVLGLNAALEGAKLDGPAGRALLALSDELRALVAKANGAGADASSALDEASTELDQLATQGDGSRSSAAQLSEASAAALSALHKAHDGVEGLGAQIAAFTGLDAETAARIQEAESHARELDKALVALEARSGASAGAIARSLAPLLGRLAQLSSPRPPER